MAKTSQKYDYGDLGKLENRIRGDMYAMEEMKWYGWGTAVGLGLFFALFLSSIGFLLWMLHLADLIH